MKVPMTREQWLEKAVKALSKRFPEDQPVPPVRVSVGWPAGRSAKGNTIGQCFQSPLVADGQPAIFISPVLDKPTVILATLLHEMVHAVVPPSSSPHRGAFVKLAKAVGLTGKWTATVASEDLEPHLTALAEKLGDFPHSVVSKGSGGRKVQTTRMLKVECVDCGMVIRTTAKWLNEVGAPTCACGGEMEAA